MGKLRQNSDPSAATDSKPPPIRGSFFLSCFGFSGEPKQPMMDRRKESSKDSNLRRRKMLFFSPDPSAVAVQPTDSDPSGLVLPISAGQGAAEAAAFESSHFQKPKQHEGKADPILEDSDGVEMDDDVASREEDKCQDPLSMTSSNQLVPPAKASSLSRSLSLPAPAKQQMKAASPKNNTSRMSYGGGLLIAALTLVVMLVWGRICAIVCVSGFLYVIPLLRDSGKEKISEIERSDSRLNDVVVDELRMSSDHDNNNNNRIKKKKRQQVVLDGFLQRNRRNSFGWKSGDGRSEWQ